MRALPKFAWPAGLPQQSTDLVHCAPCAKQTVVTLERCLSGQRLCDTNSQVGGRSMVVPFRRGAEGTLRCPLFFVWPRAFEPRCASVAPRPSAMCFVACVLANPALRSAILPLLMLLPIKALWCLPHCRKGSKRRQRRGSSRLHLPCTKQTEDAHKGELEERQKA